MAYEIARSDGEISNDELSVLMQEVEKISAKVGKDKLEILNLVEEHSRNSVSFHEFIEDINKKTKMILSKKFLARKVESIFL